MKHTPFCLLFEEAAPETSAAEAVPQGEAATTGSAPENAQAVPAEAAPAAQQVSPEPAQQAVTDALLRSHFNGLLVQAEQLRSAIPEFDLSRELGNPRFLRMTAPDVGISVEDAFYAIHHRELQDAAAAEAARRTEQKVTNAVRAGAARPVENGSGSTAQSAVGLDVRHMTDTQRAELKRMIHEAAAGGRKLYLSDILLR